MELVEQVSIAWSAAHQLCEEAMGRAQELQVHVSIAVVDRSGKLTAFLRDNNAPFHCSDIACDKAYTAASFGLPTHGWSEAFKSLSPGVSDGLLQRDRMVMFGGGYPIWMKDKCVGGIGVSGASEAQDMECAVVALNKIGADIEADKKGV